VISVSDLRVTHARSVALDVAGGEQDRQQVAVPAVGLGTAVRDHPRRRALQLLDAGAEATDARKRCSQQHR
jgi:hypothetical protein